MELVIVLIILGILAVTALSKFINLNDEATESTIRYTVKAFQTAVNLANQGWRTKNANSGLYNLSSLPYSEDPNYASRGTSGIDINSNGWPTGLWEDILASAPIDTPEDSGTYGAINLDTVDDCAQVWIGLMDSTQTVARGSAQSGDYQVNYLGDQECLYVYKNDPRYRFIYDADNGEVEYIFVP
ncbi:type II secretion system protein [Corallincola platygyrae]|uniref:type II secretion system protein n=1 Tax=Corallincola platygyrae TaxID=1193278 RepID=UPI003CD0BF4D